MRPIYGHIFPINAYRRFADALILTYMGDRREQPTLNLTLTVDAGQLSQTTGALAEVHKTAVERVGAEDETQVPNISLDGLPVEKEPGPR